MSALLDNFSTLNDIVDRVNELLAFNEAAGNGDVQGPVGSTANQLAAFSSTTGKVIKVATNVSSYAYTLLDDVDASAARTTLGLGSSSTLSAATANTASAVVQRDASGNFAAGTITATLIGNASTASKLASPVTISLSGDASGSVAFDGSSAVTLEVAVANDSHTHQTSNVVGLDAVLGVCAKTNTVNTFTAANRGAVSVLATSGTITANLNTSNNFSTTLSASSTLANPTNQVAGQSGAIAIIQGAGGSKTLTYGSNWKFSNGAPDLQQTAGAVDVLYYYVIESGRIHATISKA